MILLWDRTLHWVILVDSYFVISSIVIYMFFRRQVTP